MNHYIFPVNVLATSDIRYLPASYRVGTLLSVPFQFFIKKYVDIAFEMQ